MKEVEQRTDRQRRGRPPKPLDEVRSERVVSFVTRSEFEALARLADARGKSLSAVIHRILSSKILEGN